MTALICPLRFCRGALDVFTDRLGRVITRCKQCDRRRAGVCRDCPLPVDGAVGKAIRCTEHKRQRRRERERDWMSDEDNRARKNRRWRQKWRSNSAFRARRRETAKQWRLNHPDRVRRHKRNYLLKQPAAYLATQRRHNQNPERIQKKRAWALRRYYELHPTRPDPHCSGCNVPIDWQPGHGRPRATCDRCCSPSELRRRQRGYNARAYDKRRARRLAA